MPITKPKLALLAAALVAVVAAGCGSSSSSSSGGQTPADSSPPGDIPDNQAYVRYAAPGFSVKVPEGWSRTATGGAVVFTDKLNAIRVEATPAQAAPSATALRQTALPKLAATVKGFRPGSVSTVKRSAGNAVRITYLATAKPNAVTGKAGQDAVERYVFFHRGRDLVLTLSGPKGADNVDPWRLVTDSVRWTG